MNKMNGLIVIFALIGSPAWAKPMDQSAAVPSPNEYQAELPVSLLIESLMNGVTPKGAVKVPQNEMPRNLAASAWRIKGSLYILTPHYLEGIASRPAFVATENKSGRTVSVFTMPVYFIESKTLLTP